MSFSFPKSVSILRGKKPLGFFVIHYTMPAATLMAEPVFRVIGLTSAVAGNR
jgi:hypothetical protein